MKRANIHRSRGGFSLVELAVVVIIIGVLAAFGVPRFKDAVERSKASEAFAYLSAVRSAQERFQARNGVYADDLTKLDIQLQAPKYFGVGTMSEDHTTAQGAPTWALTLTRDETTSSYGAYTITYTQDGASETDSTIFSDEGLRDSINPMG